MSFDISLTAGMRADLTSLQGTAQLLNRTQQRLSSGKAVNSAVDNPSAFFAAQDHINHASDLSARKSDMGEAIQAVNAANTGITNITTLINQAQGLVQSAQSANTTTRASLAAQFNTLRVQINQLASDSGYNGKNFLQGDTLNVLFNESGTSVLVVTGFQGSSTGLGITTAARATGTAVAGQALGANLATGQAYTLTHSGVVHTSTLVVTQTVTPSSATLVAGNGSASTLNGQVVTLGHAGIASAVTVWETINATSAGVLSTASLTAGAYATAGHITLGDTMSAFPTTLTVQANGTTLARGTDYTATFASHQVTISMLQATAHAIDVSYAFKKTLTASPSAAYVLTQGGLKTAAQITFNKNFATASSIKVDYTYQAAVDASKYTLNIGTTSTAGSIRVTAGNTISGTVAANFNVNQLLWGSDAALATDIDNLNTAITTLRTQASTMAANLSVITTRQTWSQSMIANLQAGSDNLTLADMNEEGANMLALQTRQQLGIQALSLASQSNQSVMRLFG